MNFRWGAGCVPILCISVAGCSSAGDPQRVEAQARSFKSTAADATNMLLYMVKGLDVQTSEVEILRKASNAMRRHPEAQGLTGFMSLAPELVGWSMSLHLTQPARTELKAATATSQSRIGEVGAAVLDLGARLSEDHARLGSSAAKLEEAYIQLKEAAAILGKFASAMTTYLDTANGLESTTNAMLRELDTLSGSRTPQDSVATIARLSGFLDQLLTNSKKIDETFETERACKDGGLGSLLGCFRALNSLPNLPPDLSRELREVIGLVEDVRKGVPFSPRAGLI
jgi:hypothetical protein